MTTIKLLLSSLAIFTLGCNQPAGGTESTSKVQKSKAMKTVEAHGFTKVHITGSAMFGCSQEDSVFKSKNFSAMSPSGQPVKGVVCCGLLFKGCTIRL